MVAESERALLDTVRSRLRLVRFAPLDVGDIEAIVSARAGVDAERAGALARLGRGSAGRALKLADGAEPPIRELLGALGERGAWTSPRPRRWRRNFSPAASRRPRTSS